MRSCDIYIAGQVRGVAVIPLSPTSVNVSWIKLNSNDVTSYLVYYSLVDGGGKRQSGEERGVYSGDAGWGEVEGLQGGNEYRFQVTASVLINGLEREGGQRSVVSPDSIATLKPAGNKSMMVVE